MNYIDIIITVSLFYGLVKGFSNGIVKEVTGVLGFVLGVYFAIHFSVYIQPQAQKILNINNEFTPLISFIVLFIVSFFAIKMIGSFLDGITRALSLGLLSKTTGAIFGTIKIFILFCFLLVFAEDHQVIDEQKNKKAILLSPMIKAARIIMPEINNQKNQLFEKIESETERAKEKIEKINLE